MESELSEIVMKVKWKKHVDGALTCLWTSAEISEFVQTVAEQGQLSDTLAALTVKRLVSTALDGDEKRILLASRTLHALAAQPTNLRQDQYCAGFQQVLETADDLEVSGFESNG